MYNTWDIACNIFPFWAGLMLWLIYLLFRGEKPSKELVVSTWKEFYSKCYELENREKISETKQNRFLIGTFCENISKNAIKNTYLTGLELEMKLRSERSGLKGIYQKVVQKRITPKSQRLKRGLIILQISQTEITR